MSKPLKICTCDDWKNDFAMIDNWGKRFVYCPWCGKELKVAEMTDNQPAIVTTVALDAREWAKRETLHSS